MAAALKIGTVANVPVKDLEPDPLQPRRHFDDKHIDALATSIKAIGIQQPLQVFKGQKGKLTIKDGECRWRAAKQAKLKVVPVLLAEKDPDDARIRIDQVAVNNLRQSLTKMELAQFLVQLRDVNKLTANDIAATLEKKGLKAMTPAEIQSTMKFIELKPWAQDMLNAGEIDEAGATALLVANDQPAALKIIEKNLRNTIGFSGRATRRDIVDDVQSAFSDTAIRLDREHSWDPKVPIAHFNWKTACKGCEHLKTVFGTPYCLNAKQFAKKNDEAKAAGLLPGGKKPKSDKPATPKQQEAQQQEKAEAREQTLERKQLMYLHGFLRGRLQQDIEDKPVLWGTLTDFTALQRPGTHGQETRIPFHKAAKDVEIKCLADMLGERYSHVQIQLRREIAMEAIEQLPFDECLMLAHFLYGKELRPIWKVDQAYLDLLQKAELIAICETHCPLPEKRKTWSTAKVGELTAAILAKADEIPVAPALQKLYLEIGPPQDENGMERWDDFHDGHGEEDEEGYDEGEDGDE